VTDDLWVVLVPQNHQFVALPKVFLDVGVHFGDQRAGAIAKFYAAGLQFLARLGRDAVRPNDQSRALLELIERIHYIHALTGQQIHDLGVVNQGTEGIHRAVGILRRIHGDIHRPTHAPTKSGRLRKLHFHKRASFSSQRQDHTRGMVMPC
jgi:hypothetical protein